MLEIWLKERINCWVLEKGEELIKQAKDLEKCERLKIKNSGDLIKLQEIDSVLIRDYEGCYYKSSVILFKDEQGRKIMISRYNDCYSLDFVRRVIKRD